MRKANRCFCQILGMLCVLLTVCHPQTLADSAKVTEAPTAPPAQSPGESEEEKKKEQAASLAVVLAGLIVMLLVAMGAGVLLWGNRTRRLTRKPLPEQTPFDPLWYLKPGPEQAGKQEPDSADDAESVEDLDHE